MGTVAGSTEVAQLQQEMDERSLAFETAPPGLILSWARGRFGPRLAIASSFQDAVLIDVAMKVDPAIEIIFLDTGSHFPETLEYVETLRARYDMNLRITQPAAEADRWPCGSAQCCEFRKVLPLRDALVGRDAWVTGLKRVDAPTRRTAAIVAYDEGWGMVKVNPIAAWSEEDIDRYAAEHRLPDHPLRSKGYLSIGCAPTTTPVALGQDPRAGRWAGSDKVECGLHD